MKKFYLSAFAAILVSLFSGFVAFAGEEGCEGGVCRIDPVNGLSNEETDKLLEDIFENAKKITRVQASMFTRTTGGYAKEGSELVQYDEVKFATPAKIWKLSREDSKEELPFKDCSLVIFDGKYLWEMMPKFDDEPREVTRRTVNKDDQKVSGNAGLAVFLLRSDVKSAKELREEFDSIVCVKEGAGEKTVNHFTLVPKNKAIVMELWFPAGAAVPSKVKTVTQEKLVGPGMKKGEYKTKTKTEIRELNNVKTNLDGLAPFNTETFILPYEKGMSVIDDESGEPIPAETVKKDLDDMRKEMQKEAEGKDK
ncbi:MAG: hypothetical protein JXR97_11195 [Planctomycetes bacterium]|nr:hypothetical protein [Planctomycetota bacterium]